MVISQQTVCPTQVLPCYVMLYLQQMLHPRYMWFRVSHPHVDVLSDGFFFIEHDFLMYDFGSSQDCICAAGESWSFN